MKKILILLLMVNSLVMAKSIKMPIATFQADGAVTDIIYKDAKLYASTSAGVVDIFDMKSKKIINKIKIPKIKNFMGDDINAKIYSVDISNNTILLLAQGLRGFREVYLYNNSNLKKIINVSDKLTIAKAKFIDNDNILLALLSNDIISYNIKTKKENWKVQASMSKFSNFAMNEDKTKVIIADESGDLHLIDVKSSKLLKTLSGQNLDNVFALDYKNNTIITAGQDRRAVVYDLTSNSAYYKTSHFLIYSSGLSPSAKLAAFASDEKNNVTVFKTSTKTNIAVFGGNKMTLTKILFINENNFFVASDDKVINFYKIK